MAFVSDVSRGIICAEVYWHTPGAPPARDFQSSVFILDIEGVLSKVPLSSAVEQRREEWKDLSPSAAMFSYHVGQDVTHKILLRGSYAAGFSYISPTQLLDPNNPTGPRCFFVYDFNPHRKTLDPLTPEGSDPKTGYRKSASEITREVVGGLSCWKMRFDLPAAEAGLEECYAVLIDGGFVLVEVRCLTILSDGFGGDTSSLN